MNLRYRVELSQTERTELTALLSAGKHAARRLKRAQILLAADAGASDDDIAISVGVGGSTVYRTKQRFVLGNLGRRSVKRPRPGASRKKRGAKLGAKTWSQWSPAKAIRREPGARNRNIERGALRKRFCHQVGWPTKLSQRFSSWRFSSSSRRNRSRHRARQKR